MLEWPETTTIARQITDTLAGKTITAVEAAHTSHGFAFYNHDAAHYPALLEGNVLTACTPAGSFVDLTIGDMRLAFNDGVNIRFVAPGAKLPPKYQFRMEFDDASGIVCTVQMYGAMMVYPQGVTDNFYYNVAHEKPSPLSDEFDRAYFDALIAEAEDKISVKALLATQQRIPGLGNGVLQDILFNARVNPQKKLRDTDKAEYDALFASIKETLAAMVEGGGRDTVKDLFAHPGGYITTLSTKTKQRPCPVCASPITRKAYLGGNVYFCPTCQPL